MKNILITLVLVMFYSCMSNTSPVEMRNIVEKWNGKEIIFPKDVLCMSIDKDTTYVSSNLASYKILVYIDSIGCMGCKSQLYKWNRLIEEVEDEMGDLVSFLFYFQPKSFEDIQALFKKNNFRYPSYIDVDNKLNKLNNFSADSRFQTFLLDKNNKVVLIGNPVNNSSIWELYKQIIKGEEKANLVESSSEIPMTSIEIEEQILELRELKLGEINVVKFYLQNTGNVPLVLTNVDSSCGCTIPEWSKKPIEANEKTEIVVQIIPENKGYFRKTVAVYCNVKSSPIILRINGEVK